jgi:hypothetical protein
MRRGSRRIADNTAGTNRKPPKTSRVTRGQMERIRERREQIYQREGILSDSAALIREDRDRQR